MKKQDQYLKIRKTIQLVLEQEQSKLITKNKNKKIKSKNDKYSEANLK